MGVPVSFHIVLAISINVAKPESTAVCVSGV